MFEYYFYESNRDIVTENVVKCYSMISKYGFQPSMGKIKMVEGDDLKGEKLYKVSVHRQEILLFSFLPHL